MRSTSWPPRPSRARQEHPDFLSILEPVFTAVDAGHLQACTSSLTLLEVLVIPYRVAHLPLAERYEQLLTCSRGLRMVDIDRAQVRAAAQIRAGHPAVRAPDALQMAAALAGGCRIFVTNDRKLPVLPGLRIVQIKDYTTSGYSGRRRGSPGSDRLKSRR